MPNLACPQMDVLVDDSFFEGEDYSLVLANAAAAPETVAKKPGCFSSVSKLAVFVTLGLAATLALALGLGLGIPASTGGSLTSASGPTDTIIVSVGPSMTDSLGRPYLNPAKTRCALANATSLPVTSFSFVAFVAVSGSLSIVPSGSPLNAAVSCGSLGYSNVPSSSTGSKRRRLQQPQLPSTVLVATNTTLTATQASVEFTVLASLAQTFVNEVTSRAASDPGFALLSVSSLGNSSATAR